MTSSSPGLPSTASGTLRIGTFDRSTDPANQKYDYSLLTADRPEHLRHDRPSRPSSPIRRKGDRWFAGTVDPDFPLATAFLGDYSGIGIVPGTTHVVALWTDMREDATFAGATRKGEDAYFAYVN